MDETKYECMSDWQKYTSLLKERKKGQQRKNRSVGFASEKSVCTTIHRIRACLYMPTDREFHSEIW